MWFDPISSKMVWYYIPADQNIDTDDFEVINFEDGFYACATSIDVDDNDGEQVYSTIKDWVSKSGCFQLDERKNHYTMFHMSAPETKGVMGYAQLEVFVPIRAK